MPTMHSSGKSRSDVSSFTERNTLSRRRAALSPVSDTGMRMLLSSSIFILLIFATSVSMRMPHSPADLVAICAGGTSEGTMLPGLVARVWCAPSMITLAAAAIPATSLSRIGKRSLRM